MKRGYHGDVASVHVLMMRTYSFHLLLITLPYPALPSFLPPREHVLVHFVEQIDVS